MGLGGGGVNPLDSRLGQLGDLTMEEKKDDVYDYEKLIVWQKAMDLVEEIYLRSRDFPKEEVYGLTSQLRRAATSAPLNISEGQVRGSNKEFRRFLLIAKGSACEVNTILQICLRMNYIKEDEYLEFRKKIVQITRMISGLIRSLK